MWEKIVLNLLSNAVKFTFEGEIEVALHAQDGRVELVVRDTGTGIDAAALPHLFERFYRVQGARARTHEGSGIGLALVSDLVRLHGGSIAVSSQPGCGSTFTVSIPTGSVHLPSEQVQADPDALSPSMTRMAYAEEVFSWLGRTDGSAQTVEEPSPSHVERVESACGAGAREGEAHILLVEDNADMRAYLVLLLRKAGYTVKAVEHGGAALSVLRERVPDLLLSDVMMPELDGLQLLTRVRADPRTQRLPVILLSARAGEEATIEGLALGTDDYLMKPFSARELLARVRANVELGRLRELAVQRAQRQVRLLQGLYEALLAVHSTLSSDVVLDLISQEARDLLGASYALTSFTSDQEQAQAMVSAAWNPAEHPPFATPPTPSTTPSPSQLNDAHHRQYLTMQLEPLRARYTDLLHQLGASPYWLEAPLITRDGAEIGQVQVVKTREEPFTQEDRLVLLQLVQMTSIALEHARSYQAAQHAVERQQEQESFTTLVLSLLARELYAPLSTFI